MANALYSKAKEGFLNAALDLNTATIKAALVDGYTPNLSTHEFVSDVTGAGGTLVQSQTLTSPTITGGAFDAADVTFTSVAGGSTPDHILIYQSSAVTGGADVAATAQRVIALIDTTTGVTLPVTTNGGNITVTWGANIFSL